MLAVASQATATAGVQEGGHTSRTYVAVPVTRAQVDTSTFALPMRRRSQPKNLVPVVTLSRQMDHGSVTRMVIAQV